MQAEGSPSQGDSHEQRVRWTPDQDAVLRSIVDTYGTSDWNVIADNINSKFEGAEKSARQCRQRWQKHIHPALSKHQWSEREEVDLLLAHQKYKNSWSDIACALKGRNNNSIKNRFYTIFRKVRNKIRKDDFDFGSRVELLQVHYMIALMETYISDSTGSEEEESKSGKDFVFKLVQDIDLAALKEYKRHLAEVAGGANSMEQLFAELVADQEDAEVVGNDNENEGEPAPIAMLDDGDADVQKEEEEEKKSKDGLSVMQCCEAEAGRNSSGSFLAVQKRETSPLDTLTLGPASSAPKYSPCVLSAGPAATAEAAANAPCFQNSPADLGFSEFTAAAEEMGVQRMKDEESPFLQYSSGQTSTYTPTPPPTISVTFAGQTSVVSGPLN